MAVSTGEIVFEQEERCTRVAYVEDGRRVSDLAVFDRWMWLGRAKLHVGGIGDVGTHERSRNRGLARQVLNAAVEWMASRFDMSVLFGIPDFYSRFGYVACIPEYHGCLQLRDVDRAQAVLPSRPFVPEDLPYLLEASRQRACSTVGCLERDSSWYDPRRMSSGFGRRAKIRVFEGENGPLGYLVYDDLPHQANVAEVVSYAPNGPARPAAVYETAAALMAEVARGRGLATVDVYLPPTDPFMLYCRRFGCSVTTSFHRDRGGMARVCNLRSTMERLLPELEERLPAGAPGLWLETDLGGLGLVREGTGLRLTEERQEGLPALCLPQSLLTVLLLGYRSVEEVAADRACKAEPGAIELAQALFPLREPFIPAPDRF